MAGGPRLHGAQRGTPRRVAHEGFVADNGRDSSPSWAPFFASPWTTAPTKLEKGGFGVNADGRLASVNSDLAAYLPVVGNRPAIRASVSGAYTLLDKDSGAAIYWDQAAGILFTLPVPRVGMWFEFFVTVTATSSAHKFITDSASTFLLGTFAQSTDGTYTEARHTANGTTIRSWSGNGSTTGGIAGDVVRVHAVSSTIWMVTGRGSATGSEATPFGTS